MTKQNPANFRVKQMKTKKYPEGNSKNASDNVTQDQRREKRTSTMITGMIKAQTRSPRGRKALEDYKNTLKLKKKSLESSKGAKIPLKGSLADPAPACSPTISTSEIASNSKEILDKEKLKKLLRGVAQFKEVGKAEENAPEPAKGKQSSNDEVEKRTFKAMHKENIMYPIINQDKLKKIINGLSPEKSGKSEHTEADVHLRTETVVPVVNKDKLKTLLNKVCESQEGESEANTSSEVEIVEDHNVSTDLPAMAANTSSSQAQVIQSVKRNLKRQRPSMPSEGVKSAKLMDKTSIVGIKEKLRRRISVQKLDVSPSPKLVSPSANVPGRVKRKEIAVEELASSSSDDEVVFLKDPHESIMGDKSKVVLESVKAKTPTTSSAKPVKSLTCNFDKQKLIGLLSRMPQIQDKNANSSMSPQSASASSPEINPKQLPDGNRNSLEKFGEPEGPFSVSNELLKSNVLTKSGDGSITLRGIMIDRLNAARFRYINEQLYMHTGDEAQNFFTKDPEAFTVYHQGYQSQVNKWPISPLNIIIDDIARRKQPLIIADFGCGEARLARSVPNKVHSFDLVALNELVTACNMAKVPLKSTSVDVAVFCLSLMGTNLSEYLLEANRILKMGGILKIAEVESRFQSVPEFIKQLGKLGFKLMKQDTSHKMFVMLDFTKMKNCTKKQLINITLHPCLYKKRRSSNVGEV